MLVETYASPVAPAAQRRTGDSRLSSSRSPNVSVVIPTLNEAKNVGCVLERLPDCVDEVIVVDGRSTDDTVRSPPQLLKTHYDRHTGPPQAPRLNTCADHPRLS